jgi:leader peptidase (prepilin peptidase)/N-methyltransferase
MLYAISFIFGALIGSFLNVCILRIPAGRSIAYPPSHCPRCRAPIRWYDNIPMISYLILMGRCRSCRGPISFRYPLVEFLTALFSLAAMIKFGPSISYLIYLTFVSSLVVITFIDLDHQIIPDVISLPGIPLGFLASFIVPEITYKESLIGIILGGGVLLLIAIGYEYIAKMEGMGGGDVKLLAMIGAFLGWKGVLFTVFSGSLIGTVIGVTIMVAKGKDSKYAIPFGPFLSMGALLYLFFGEEIIYWYLGMI